MELFTSIASPANRATMANASWTEATFDSSMSARRRMSSLRRWNITEATSASPAGSNLTSTFRRLTDDGWRLTNDLRSRRSTSRVQDDGDRPNSVAISAMVIGWRSSRRTRARNCGTVISTGADEMERTVMATRDLETAIAALMSASSTSSLGTAQVCHPARTHNGSSLLAPCLERSSSSVR